MFARTRFGRIGAAGAALLVSATLVTGCVDSKETEVTYGTITEVQEAYTECIKATREETDTKLRAQLQLQCKQVFDKAVAYKEKVAKANPGRTSGPFNVKVKQQGVKIELTGKEGDVLIKLGEALAPLAAAGKILEPVPGSGMSPPSSSPRLGQRPARGILRSDRAQEFFYGVAEVSAADKPVGRFFLFPLKTTRGDDGWYTHTVTFWPALDWAAYATSGTPLVMSMVVDVGVETATTPLDVHMVEIFEVGGSKVPWASHTFTVKPTDQALMQGQFPVDSKSLEESITAWQPPVVAHRRYFRDVASQQERLFNVLARLDIYHGYPDGTAHPAAGINRAELAAVARESWVRNDWPPSWARCGPIIAMRCPSGRGATSTQRPSSGSCRDSRTAPSGRTCWSRMSRVGPC